MILTGFRSGSFCSGFIILAMAATSLAAQSSGWEGKVEVSAAHRFSADTEDGRAGRERDKVAVFADVSAPVDEGRIGWSFGYVRKEDAWEGSLADPIFGSLHDGIETVSLGLNYRRRVRGPWGLFARGNVDWAVAVFDNDGGGNAELSLADGFSGMLAAGASYRFSPDLHLAFGAFYADRLGEDSLVLPIVFLRWRIDEHWSLQTADGIYFTYDLGANRRQLVTASVTYESTDFAHSRMDVSEEGTGEVEPREVYGEEESIRLAVAYRFNLSRTWGLRASLGYHVARDVELRTNDQSLGEIDLDAGVSVGAGFEIRF